jgi:hypothetical protein
MQNDFDKIMHLVSAAGVNKMEIQASNSLYNEDAAAMNHCFKLLMSQAIISYKFSLTLSFLCAIVS